MNNPVTSSYIRIFNLYEKGYGKNTKVFYKSFIESSKTYIIVNKKKHLMIGL